MIIRRYIAIVFTLTLIVAAQSRSDEGMWLLDGIGKLPLKKMKSLGLSLKVDQIYNSAKPSLKDAIVLLGGGTGSFVSNTGLVMTNHHVAYRALQTLSTTEHDYLIDGFWAKSPTEEIPAPSYTASLLKSMKDVTIEVLGAVAPDMTVRERAEAIDRTSREIERRTKGMTDDVCQVVEMYNGVKYYLFVYQKYSDVRLVYAPPGSIGNYGGEIDNWMWPRHTGDFALFRVYADQNGRPAEFSKKNVPFRPISYLPISTKGFQEGSFVMVMGYPGKTYRCNDSYAVSLSAENTYPVTVELYKTRMDILEKWAAKDPATGLKLANKIKGLANTYKNRKGAVEGFARYGVIQRKQTEEAAFQKWLSENPELNERYGSALQKIAEISAELRLYNTKQLYLSNVISGSDLLQIACRIDTILAGRKSPNPSDSLPLTLNEKLKRLLPALRTTYKDYNAGADKEILGALCLKSGALPTDQRISAVDSLLKRTGGLTDTPALVRYIDSLYSTSMLATYESLEVVCTKDSATIAADPLVHLADEIVSEYAQLRRMIAPINMNLSNLRTTLTEGWIFWKGGNIYPDANRTMRLSYGTVTGYDPRDAVSYKPVTHLAGAVEKATDTEPFDLPKKLIELEKNLDFGRYADQKSGDIVTCFLSNLDITGGNSGSPVINGKGEFIGAAFDGNYEALTGDFEFDPKLNRTITVDARYILFVLDKFSGAKNILEELDIR
jgi:hypothetical protein